MKTFWKQEGSLWEYQLSLELMELGRLNWVNDATRVNIHDCVFKYYRFRYIISQLANWGVGIYGIIAL